MPDNGRLLSIKWPCLNNILSGHHSLSYGLFAFMAPVYFMGQVIAQNETMEVERIVANEYVLSKNGVQYGTWGFDSNNPEDNYPTLSMNISPESFSEFSADGIKIKLEGLSAAFNGSGIIHSNGVSASTLAPRGLEGGGNVTSLDFKLEAE
jgi:hypothetical protein